MASEDQQQTFTYRGRSLEELVPRIRQELGDDAVIVSRRETTSGGVGGFFAKREIEVEVRPGESAGPDVAAAFAAQLAEAQQRAGGADLPQPPTGGARPMTAPEIDALPGSADVTVDDLFPPTPPTQAQGLAALFNAGMPPEEPVAEAPAPVPDEEPVARREVLDDDEWEVVYGDDDEDDDEPEAFAPAPVAPEPPADEPTGMFDYLGSAAADDHAPMAAAPVPAPLPTPGVPLPSAAGADVPPIIEPFTPAAGPIADAAHPAPPLPEPGVEPAPEPGAEPVTSFWDPPVAAEPAPLVVPVGDAPPPIAVPFEPEAEAEPVAAEAAESVPDPIVPAAPTAVPAALPAAATLVAERLVARGLRQGLADAIAQEAMSGLAPLLPDADPKDLVTDALARRIPTHPLRSGPGVIGFVGPGGAGKTRCVARLAAAHARHGALPVSVVALRSPDGGAELRRLLAPYGVELHAVESGAEGAARIAGPRGEGLVIVDTPGVSPRSTGELRALGSELDALAPDELHLVVSATIGPAAAGELVGGVRELGVGALVPTHTDETEMLGTVVGLAIDSGLPLSFLARGQAVEAGLRPASSTELARDLVP
jgi:flagellar biosynthesis GTPase FlhF